MLRIADLHGQIEALLADLPVDALNWRPFAGQNITEVNSLAVLALHVCGAEHFWIGEVIGGLPRTRDRQAELSTQVSSPDEVYDVLRRTLKQTREILGSLAPADLDRTLRVDGREVPLRWAILHVIDHTALHLGHMQMTYQLVRQGRAFPAPTWEKRLPVT
jgi:uncharacterized damage-inducible protein DinB